MVESNRYLAILSRKAGRFNDHIPDTILYVFNQKKIPIDFYGLPQYRINENSRIDDGEVEVLLIRETSPWEFFSLLMDIISRRKKQIIKVIGKGKVITVESVKPLPVQADGDLIQLTPVNVRVLHRAINIIVP